MLKNDLTLWSDPMCTELVRVVREKHCDSYKELMKNTNTVITHTNTYVTRYMIFFIYTVYIFEVCTAETNIMNFEDREVFTTVL